VKIAYLFLKQYHAGLKKLKVPTSWNFSDLLAVILKTGGLNLLKPSGAVQACNGISLPLLAVILLFSFNFKKNIKQTHSAYERFS
jgi:hypothetical protein